MKQKNFFKKLILPLILMAICTNLNAATGSMTIGGTSVPDLTQNADGTGWTWAANTATLNLTTVYTGNPIAINCQFTDIINLVYTGNVSITSAAAGTLYCYGNLNITGSGGTLTLNSQSTDPLHSAIEAYAGALTIGGAAVVNATSAGSGTDPYAAVIYGNAGVTISGSASVTATATGADATGIWSAYGDLTISTSGTVTANGSGTGSALRLNGSLRKLNVTSGTLNLTGNPMNFDTYIAPVITGGTVNISGTQVYLATLTLSGVNTETTITAVTAPASGYGIQRMESDANGNLYFWLPAGSHTVTLTAGGNIYTGTVNVTTDHAATATLNIKNTSDDATLSALTVSEGTLTPTFSASVTDYTVTVANSISSITINATANDGNATLSGNTGTQNLNIGENEFNILVTAEDQTTTETYKIIVTRGGTVGIDDINSDNGIQIYPNPATDKIIIDNAGVEIGEVSIFNINGKKLSTLNSQLSTLEINLADYANGIYLIQINGKTTRIIKQ